MSKDLTSSNERQRRSLTRSDVEAVLPDKTAASGEPKQAGNIQSEPSTECEAEKTDELN